MTPTHIRMARNALRLTVRELAELSGISYVTISRYETEKSGLQHSSAEAIRKALEGQGIQFLENGDTALGDGVVLKESE